LSNCLLCCSNDDVFPQHMHGVFFGLQTVNMRMTIRSQKKSNNFAAVTDMKCCLVPFGDYKQITNT